MRKIFLTIAVVLVLLYPISVALAGDSHNPSYCAVNACSPPDPESMPDCGTLCPPNSSNTAAETDEENEEDGQSLIDDLLRLLGL